MNDDMLRVESTKLTSIDSSACSAHDEVFGDWGLHVPLAFELA